MKWFLLKGLILASLMFMSVLAGIQIANDGIQKIKGYREVRVNSAHSSEGDGNQPFNVSLPGQHMDDRVKLQTIEKMNKENLFSDLGKSFSNGISDASQKFLHSIFGTK